MPLPNEACVALSNMQAEAGDFVLFGIFLNPVTKEMGTYSSAGFEPGQVLGFLQNALNEFMNAAANGELEATDGTETTRETAKGAFLVH